METQAIENAHWPCPTCGKPIWDADHAGDWMCAACGACHFQDGAPAPSVVSGKLPLEGPVEVASPSGGPSGRLQDWATADLSNRFVRRYAVGVRVVAGVVFALLPVYLAAVVVPLWSTLSLVQMARAVGVVIAFSLPSFLAFRSALRLLREARLQRQTRPVVKSE